MRIDAAQTQREAGQQGQGRALGSDRQKPATSADAPSNTSGHQKWNGTAASLKPTPIRMNSSAEDQHRIEARAAAWRIEGVHQTDGDIGQVGGAEASGQQADAVEHDAGRAAAVDDVLQGRLAGLPAALQIAGQGVAGQAGHLDADVDHQQMVAEAMTTMPTVAPSSRQ